MAEGGSCQQEEVGFDTGRDGRICERASMMGYFVSQAVILESLGFGGVFVGKLIYQCHATPMV